MSVVRSHALDAMGHTCPVCKHPMTLLFFSAVCDVCEGRKRPVLERGYVLYRGAMDGQVRAEHVFRYRTDARQWRTTHDLHHLPIVIVESAGGFCWHPAAGTIQGVETAERRYLIFPNEDYDAGPHRAHIWRRSR